MTVPLPGSTLSSPAGNPAGYLAALGDAPLPALTGVAQGAYDLVAVLDVVEHIEDDVATFRGMAERLAAFGGKMSLSSPDGGPTRVSCTIPLLLERGQTGVSA